MTFIRLIEIMNQIIDDILTPEVAADSSGEKTGPTGVSSTKGDQSDDPGQGRGSGGSPQISDGRRFVWIRAMTGKLSPMQAQIIFGEGVGGKLDVVATRTLDPAEYGDDLNTLIARYPAPIVIMDNPPKEGTA